MTAKESIIDELGQITFRIETNLQTLVSYNKQGKNWQACLLPPIQSDIEKLKHLKKKLEIWMD